MIKLSVIPKTLHFKQPAKTSRGVYIERQIWLIKAEDTESGKYGYGECAPLPDLSCDASEDYEKLLNEFCNETENDGAIKYDKLRHYPSMLFGLETALKDLNAESGRLWDTAFSRGEAGIPINGLIWMGNFDEMLARIKEKMNLGFRCIKLKIGAIDFEKEIELLSFIRKHFSADDVELRVDANGAFSPSDAMEKLERLSKLNLHSIEQPIRAEQWEEMARLTASTPLPIALDEELIGINDIEKKKELLDIIKPQYIILKPSLHGGISGSEEWIDEANKRNIPWWITSALESNIGLNAIAQWCSSFNNPLPQGLGTGALFTDNIPMPLEIRKDCLWRNV